MNAREAGAEPDEQRQLQIAYLWHQAALPLRTIDPDFAVRCFDKGGYWMQPEIWSSDQIREKGIAIDQMIDATRRVYSPS